LAAQLDPITDREERWAKEAELNAAQLIEFRYVESPGRHDWPFWRDASAQVADFHWHWFQKALAARAAAAAPKS
jgi:S-formylglutathione hydrolase FrmB